MPDLTLQINLCPGDVAYCEALVTAMVAAHRPRIAEAVAIIDCCRPQSTAWVDIDQRIPTAAFAANVKRINEIAASLVGAGVIDRCVHLRPEDAILRELGAKYFGVATTVTHDHLAHAFLAYFAGLDAARTRFVAHYDADVFLRQPAGRDWAADACSLMEERGDVLAVSPRICPPPTNPRDMITPGPHSAWSDYWMLDRQEYGWRSDWISTRAFCMDLERLKPLLPLTPAADLGKTRRQLALTGALTPIVTSAWWHRTCGQPSLVGRITARLRINHIPPAPLPPEVLFQKLLRRTDLVSVYLDDPEIWITHPDTKPREFLAILDPLLRAVTKGKFPEEQRGCGSLRIDAWTDFLARSHV